MVLSHFSTYVFVSPMHMLAQKLKALKNPLRELHKCKFSNLSERLDKEASDLEHAQTTLRSYYSNEARDVVKLLASEHSSLLDAGADFQWQMIKD